MKKGDVLQVKFAISYVSVENARLNMESDCNHWDFTAVRENARNVWNDWLGKIEVKGETHKQQTKFYTDLWHVLMGGDGAISISAEAGKSIFLWGDSFFGEVVNNKRNKSTPLVLGNVWQIVDDKQAVCCFGGTADNPKPLLSAEPVDGHRTVLWPGHGFVKGCFYI